MKNAQNNWFKRRRYGYGWVPVTWQGWTVILLFMIMVFAGLLPLKETQRHHLSDNSIGYIIYVFALTSILYFICRKRGPSPKWRWGKRVDDSSLDDF